MRGNSISSCSLFNKTNIFGAENAKIQNRPAYKSTLLYLPEAVQTNQCKDRMYSCTGQQSCITSWQSISVPITAMIISYRKKLR